MVSGKEMKVAVILPSRGLIFSRTAEEVVNCVKEVPHKFFFSHRLPIPQCFEKPTHEALVDKEITHLWFVEDDMRLPPATLQIMLKKDKAVVTYDYPVNNKGRGAVFEIDKQVIFTGTGCLLVKREVFDELESPYFRTDRKWNIKNFGDHFKMTAAKNSNLEGYGLHDVNFCMELYKRNIPIHRLPRTLSQRKLIALGKQGTNDGAHQIEEWNKVEKDQLLNTIKSWPVMPSSNLVTVITDKGELLTDKKHADKLVKEGIAKHAPKRKLVVDWNE